MVGVSLSPMHNVGIYRTHWAIYQNVVIGNNHEKKSKGTKNIFRVPKLQSKRRLAHHDAAVANEDGPKQTLSESVGHHFVRTKGDECDKTSLTRFAHKISTNVDVARKLTAHLVFTHGNTSEVVFIDLSGFGSLMPQIP